MRQLEFNNADYWKNDRLTELPDLKRPEPNRVKILKDPHRLATGIENHTSNESIFFCRENLLFDLCELSSKIDTTAAIQATTDHTGVDMVDGDTHTMVDTAVIE